MDSWVIPSQAFLKEGVETLWVALFSGDKVHLVKGNTLDENL